MVIVALVVIILVANNIINTLIMRGFKMPWKESIYAGALLSQIGEFSFVLGNLAYFNQIITEYGHQMIIAVISLTLLFSPMWISLSKYVANKLF